MKVSIKTYGCRMNQRDSELWQSWFAQHGIESGGKDPDIIVVNTCVVTEKTEKEVVADIKKIKKQYPLCSLIVTGCGTRMQQNSFSLLKEIDFIIQDLSDIDRLLPLVQHHKAAVPSPTPKTRSLIAIQNGCDNFCSYCIVPFVRGRSVSRSSKDIVKEIRRREEEGYKEVVLTGINIGSYGCSTSNHPNESRLGELLLELMNKTDIPRIRLSSIGPEYFKDALFDAFGSKRVCDHVHLSIQSGADTILRKMKRHYTTSDIYAVVERLRDIRPSISFTADMIVGFPGETEDDFYASQLLAKKIPLSKIHVFPYSPRPGTLSARHIHQIPERIKTERAKQLRFLSNQLRQDAQKKLMGRSLSVLFETKRTRGNQGLSSNYFEVVVQEKRDLKNEIREVEILSLNNNKLFGRLRRL